MKKLFVLLVLFHGISFSQSSIVGKVVNYNSQGLEGKLVEVHLTIDGNYTKYSDLTNASGNFLANNLSDVEDDYSLPDGYELSNNYPQPFNPKTIFNLTVPYSSSVSVEVYSVLGEKVRSMDRKDYSAGNHKLVLELNGLSNGVYIARIILDDKYFISRKLLLLYGSQHANDFGNVVVPQLDKPQATIFLDSITVSGDAIYTKTLYYGQQIFSYFNAGTIQVDSHFVNLTIAVKKLMLWKVPNNQLENAKIKLRNDSSFTDSQGFVYFPNIPSGRIPMVSNILKFI